MAEKYQNKYRIPSARLPSWDYRWSAAYFITICTHNKDKHDFGKIENGKMKLSHIGVLADVLWHEIKSRNQNVELGAFIVMPNHIHGILILHENDKNTNTLNIDTLNVETLHARSSKSKFMSKISPKAGSISTIIRSYKSAVTKHARRLGFQFRWQARFYDHIIKNDNSYDRITDYIINNPSKWEEDKFYS